MTCELAKGTSTCRSLVQGLCKLSQLLRSNFPYLLGILAKGSRFIKEHQWLHKRYSSEEGGDAVMRFYPAILHPLLHLGG